MTGSAMAFRENIRAFREKGFGLENALAGLIRRRWPDKPIQYAMAEWDLTEHAARKALYADASKTTLNDILHHRRGGFGLYIELLADATGTTLEQYIIKQAEKARAERHAWEARERSLVSLEARLPEFRRVGRRHD